MKYPKLQSTEGIIAILFLLFFLFLIFSNGNDPDSPGRRNDKTPTKDFVLPQLDKETTQEIIEGLNSYQVNLLKKCADARWSKKRELLETELEKIAKNDRKVIAAYGLYTDAIRFYN